MKDKHQMTINILDVEYQVLSDDEPERVRKIAEFVDKLIRETKKSAPFMSNMSAAILATLNLSEELYKIKDELDVYRERGKEYNTLLGYKEKLTEAIKEVEENNEKYQSMKYKLERAEFENKEINSLLDEYKEKFNSLRTEYELNKRTIAELQNKLLENQIELVRARKILLDFGDTSV